MIADLPNTHIFSKLLISFRFSLYLHGPSIRSSLHKSTLPPSRTQYRIEISYHDFRGTRTIPTYMFFADSGIPRLMLACAPRPLFSIIALPRPACFLRSFALPSSFTYGFEHMNDIGPRTRRLRASPCFPSLPFAPCFSPPAPRPDI